MMRAAGAVCVCLICAVSCVGRDDLRNSIGILTSGTANEPAYESTPAYSLMVFGPDGETAVWMVEDGRRLYVDRNANGDLTDDGPPVSLDDVRTLGKDRWDSGYHLEAPISDGESRHTDFELRRWNYGKDRDSYGLSLAVDGRSPMYAGWFGTFWSERPESAPVIHFRGPLTPVMLRGKEFVIGSARRRLSIAFMNVGSEKGAHSRLSIDALADDVVPRLTIEWPTAGNGPPLETSHALNERCCYWEFYTTQFQVPDGVAAGSARVLIDLPLGSMPFELTTTELKVPVVEPRD